MPDILLRHIISPAPRWLFSLLADAITLSILAAIIYYAIIDIDAISHYYADAFTLTPLAFSAASRHTPRHFRQLRLADWALLPLLP